MYNPPKDYDETIDGKAQGAGRGVDTVSRVTLDHAVSRPPDDTGCILGACATSEMDLVYIREGLERLKWKVHTTLSYLQDFTTGKGTKTDFELAAMLEDALDELLQYGALLGLVEVWEVYDGSREDAE